MSETVIAVKKYIQFELVSPEKILVSEEAAMVVVPGGDGDFGVLADHTPLVSTVRPGVVSVYAPDGAVKKIFVSGGFADVDGKICSVLAEEAVNVNEIDRAKAEQVLADVRAELATVGDDVVKKDTLTHNLAIAEAKVAAAA